MHDPTLGNTQISYVILSKQGRFNACYECSIYQLMTKGGGILEIDHYPDSKTRCHFCGKKLVKFKFKEIKKENYSVAYKKDV